MPILAVVLFIVSLIFLLLSLVVSLPVVPSTAPWADWALRLGLFFFVAAEFLAKGGLPS